LTADGFGIRAVIVFCTTGVADAGAAVAGAPDAGATDAGAAVAGAAVAGAVVAAGDEHAPTARATAASRIMDRRTTTLTLLQFVPGTMAGTAIPYIV